MAKNQVTFNDYIAKLEKRLSAWVNKGLDVLDKSIEEKSPVDTGDYIRGNRRTNAQREGSKVVWLVFNDSDYGYEVEFWFRGTPVNRHKNRKAGWPVIYRGVGARVFSRSSDENEKQIIDILTNIIKGWTQ